MFFDLKIAAIQPRKKLCDFNLKNLPLNLRFTLKVSVKLGYSYILLASVFQNKKNSLKTMKNFDCYT